MPQPAYDPKHEALTLYESFAEEVLLLAKPLSASKWLTVPIDIRSRGVSTQKANPPAVSSVRLSQPTDQVRLPNLVKKLQVARPNVLQYIRIVEALNLTGSSASVSSCNAAILVYISAAVSMGHIVLTNGSHGDHTSDIIDILAGHIKAKVPLQDLIEAIILC